MSTATRTAKTVSLEKELLREVERTKGKVSTSERLNQLLKAGLEAERRRSLDDEAAAFFQPDADRAEHRAFQSASVKSISRE
jgi:metal-responsive CopG/Arc/MetJ family transcriptional regulator